MSDAATAQELMRLCFPVGPGGVKDAWNRARAILGWPDRRIKAVWYGEAARIDHHEMKELENAKPPLFVRVFLAFARRCSNPTRISMRKKLARYGRFAARLSLILRRMDRRN